jgi:hypothetical protein
MEVKDDKKANTSASTSADEYVSTALRRRNPLSNYSSYAYNITMYAATPEAISRFVDSQKFNRNDDGFYIIAQSGGIRSTEPRFITNTGKLGPGEGLDFYIDDLNFEILLPGGDATPSVGAEMQFKIIEPYGFTFFTKWATAINALNQSSAILTKNPKPNLFQQHYVIGIRFYGYDEAGNILTGKEFSALERGQTTDNETALTDDYASFERFFPILVSKATYKLDGRTVVYNIEALAMPLQAGFSIKRGQLSKPTTIVAETVGEALQNENKSSTIRSLMEILNDQQEEEKKANLRTEVNKYSIEWNPTENIKNQKINSDSDNTTRATTTASVPTTTQGTVKTETKSQTIPPGKQLIPLPAGISILTAIDNIISKSEYISKALTAKNTENIETETGENPAVTELKWFTINPVVKPRAYDFKLNDWAYDITYQIQEYKIPYLRFLYKAKTSRYYGAHKVYDFFLTGKNTEVISYEQSYDSQFYIISAMSAGANVDSSNVGVPIKPMPTSGADPTLGKQFKGSEINNNFKANVASVADQAIANIKIIGDPDYLMQNITASPKFVSQNFKKMYGSDGYSINPYGGQIFIEIRFSLAEDYKDDGLMDVNNQIKFYSTFTAEQSKIKGVVYRLLKVKNTFSRGQFTQTLEGILVQENQLSGLKSSNASPAEQQRENKPSTQPNTQTQRPTGAQVGRIAAGPTKEQLSTLYSPRTQNKKYGPNSTASELQTSPVYIEEAKKFTGTELSARRALAVAEAAYGNTKSVQTLVGTVSDDDSNASAIRRVYDESSSEIERLKSRSTDSAIERLEKQKRLRVDDVDPKTLLPRNRG